MDQELDTHPAWMELDLDALASNYKELEWQAGPDVKIIASLGWCLNVRWVSLPLTMLAPPLMVPLSSPLPRLLSCPFADPFALTM